MLLTHFLQWCFRELLCCYFKSSGTLYGCILTNILLRPLQSNSLHVNNFSCHSNNTKDKVCLLNIYRTTAKFPCHHLQSTNMKYKCLYNQFCLVFTTHMRKPCLHTSSPIHYLTLVGNLLMPNSHSTLSLCNWLATTKHCKSPFVKLSSGICVN